ncbi:MAG: DUF2283 domain-containing protein [Balneolaceae bacterium]|nr:DUF2283 domain-containing protein [Balneolaceae bacterium]MCH8549805.1 DUF2283 domain-containing protein [Balneolaceae bacterium]
MKFKYYPETDSLYIDLSSNPGTESKEVADGVVIDLDRDGNIVGIDIDQASKKVDLDDLSFSKIPFLKKDLSIT